MMFENLSADLQRFAEEGGQRRVSLRVLVRGLLSQGFQALLVYRFFHWFQRRKIPTQPFRFLIERAVEITTGISIPAEAEIGKGCRIHHFGGIIFHPHVKMGDYCTLYHGVTFGDKGGWGEPPTVGDHVMIGAGAKILGEITIGDHAMVGANAVVTKSVPDYAIVGGIPAKIIGEHSEKASLMEQKHNATARKITVMQCRSTYTTGGGPDKTVLLSAEKHDPQRFKIVLVYLRGVHDHDFQVASWARKKGLDVHEVLEYKKIDFDNFQQIHRLIKKCDIDIFHSRDYKTAVIGYVLSWFHPRMKLLFTAHLWHDQGSYKMKFYTWLNLRALSRFHKVIAVSEDLKRFMVERGIPAQKITVVHNSIDIEEWQRSNAQRSIREEFKIPATSKIAGYVGRLRYEKDLPTLLRVARNVIADRSDTYFLLVGDGPDRKKLEEQVRDMGLSDKILFLGFRKDTINVYAALDLFVSASLTEGTPNTVLEAFAMEVPVIHTEVGGVGEIVQDGHDALLVQPGDEAGITQAVLSVLNDEALAAKLRKNGRDSVCTKYSFMNRLKTLESIYETLAKQQ